jgi:hypothetical protein
LKFPAIEQISHIDMAPQYRSPDSYLPIIVLGSPRSGTSLTARLLTQWGAYGGELHEHQPADARNARGYFEWLPLVNFHMELFQSIPVTPLHPAFESYLLERSAEARWQTAVTELVERIGRNSPCWFWKYPQYAWTLPFWTRVMPDVRYIVCLREPKAICASMAPMYIPRDIAPQVQETTILLLLWQHHLTEILRCAAASDAMMFLSYEELLAAPGLECGRLARFLGNPPAPRSYESLTADLVKCVEPDLQTASASATASLSGRQERLWQDLQLKRQDSSVLLDPTEYALQSIERELLNVVFLLNDYHYRLRESMKRVVF